MPGNPLKVFEELDPALVKLARQTCEVGLADRVQAENLKLLIG
jgi:hypothetical protein